jgi:predicted S18 family serine protease
MTQRTTRAENQAKRGSLRLLWSLGLLASLTLLVPQGAGASTWPSHREQLLPIVGVTVGQRPTGIVTNLILSFDDRGDHEGLVVQFRSTPGRFSRMAQTAVEQAIYRTAKAAGLSTDSWTVVLSVPYEGVTIYGDSLSAMVALGVVALAKGDFIPPDRVMTGTVAPDGHIAPVGAVPLKVAAANEAHMHRVLVPDEVDVTDGDWKTPFLVQVSPVGSVSQAYEALTGRALKP